MSHHRTHLWCSSVKMFNNERIHKVSDPLYQISDFTLHKNINLQCFTKKSIFYGIFVSYTPLRPVCIETLKQKRGKEDETKRTRTLNTTVVYLSIKTISEILFSYHHYLLLLLLLFVLPADLLRSDSTQKNNKQNLFVSSDIV